MSDQVNVAVVGVGSWGANLLRTVGAMENSRLSWICDRDARTLARRGRAHPDAKTTTRLEDVLADPAVEAVLIATPADAHYDCALAALMADKHVFVEKPLALRSDHAERLVAEADRRNLKLMVGHLLRHHPVVEYLKRLIDRGDLGETRYLYSQRVNLGVVRTNENAWWSLAPHDIAVACYLFDAAPRTVVAQGRCFLQSGVEDVVFGTLHFADGRMAHIHVSWLDPHKIRKITLVGSGKMAAFDDMEATEKLRIYDKGATIKQEFASYAEAVQLRTGDIVIPRIDPVEPLQCECRRFIAAVRENQPVYSDGWDGLNVVRALEAGAESLRSGGIPVELPGADAARAAQSCLVSVG